MKINIKWTNIENNQELEKFIDERIGELKKYLPERTEPIDVRVEIGRTTFHHQSGDIYHAVCDLRLPSKVLRAQADRADLNQAITEVKEELQSKIKNYKEANVAKNRRMQRLWKAIKNSSPMEWGKGKFIKK